MHNYLRVKMITVASFVSCIFYPKLKKTKTESQPPSAHLLPGEDRRASSVRGNPSPSGLSPAAFQATGAHVEATRWGEGAPRIPQRM